jgi:hypothetical protein
MRLLFELNLTLIKGKEDKTDSVSPRCLEVSSPQPKPVALSLDFFCWSRRGETYLMKKMVPLAGILLKAMDMGLPIPASSLSHAVL